VDGVAIEMNKMNRFGKIFPAWSIGVGIGIVLLLVGAWEGQFVDIYRKAIMICLECIGIG